MTSRQSDFDPRYDPAYQRGGIEAGFEQATEDPPQVVEISDAGPPQPQARQAWAGLEQQHRRYRMAGWALAGGLMALGLFGLFADLIFPPEPTYLQPNAYGYVSEPWPQRLRYAAPNLIMMGALATIVQLYLEQTQIFRLRTSRPGTLI